MRHPGHRDQAGAPIDQGLEVDGVDPTSAVFCDTQLDTPRVSQMTVEDELGFVVQVVDHHVVARFQIEQGNGNVYRCKDVSAANAQQIRDAMSLVADQGSSKDCP